MSIYSEVYHINEFSQNAFCLAAITQLRGWHPLLTVKSARSRWGWMEGNDFCPAGPAFRHRFGRATCLRLAGWLLFQLAQPFFDFGQPLGDGDKVLD